MVRCSAYPLLVLLGDGCLLLRQPDLEHVVLELELLILKEAQEGVHRPDHVCCAMWSSGPSSCLPPLRVSMPLGLLLPPPPPPPPRRHPTREPQPRLSLTVATLIFPSVSLFFFISATI